MNRISSARGALLAALLTVWGVAAGGGGATGHRALSPAVAASSDADAARYRAGRAAVVALRAAVARARARVGAMREVVRARDAAADWGQLVCLESRLPEVAAFAGRGERAWDAFRAAMGRGDDDDATLRLTQLRLAGQGVVRQLSLARSCRSSASAGGAPGWTRRGW